MIKIWIYDSILCFDSTYDSIQWYDSMLRLYDSSQWFDSMIRFYDSTVWFDSIFASINIKFFILRITYPYVFKMVYACYL